MLAVIVILHKLVQYIVWIESIFLDIAQELGPCFTLPKA